VALCAIIPLSAGPVLAADTVTVTCGQTLSANTKLANDLTDCPGAGLVIGADDITVDLNGHTIDGVFLFGSMVAGIDNTAGHAGVRIKDGTVQQFDVGVRSTGAGTAIERITIDGSISAGISFEGVTGGSVERCSVSGASEGSGVLLRGTDGVRVKDCAVSGAEDNAIRVQGSQHSRLEGNLLVDSTSGIELVDAHDNAIQHNTLKDNGVAIALFNSHDNEVADNTVSPEPGGSGTIFGNPQGIAINGGRGNRITGNTIRATCCLGGIDVDHSDNTVIDRNTVITEGTPETPSGSVVVRPTSDNTVISRNVTTSEKADGILVLDGATNTLLLQNLANGNGLDGIRVLATSTKITRNTANDNGNLGIEAVAGVVDGGGNKADGNANPAQCVGVVCT
jgi:parallel beta-helix repeat protein